MTLTVSISLNQQLAIQAKSYFWPKSKIMKILYQQLFSSCIGLAIYQLSPKNVEKCQKKLYRACSR
jgi:hypothetical protein